MAKKSDVPEKNDILLVLVGLAGAVFSFLAFFILIQPIGAYYDIWYKSTNNFWHYFLSFLVWYAGAYLTIKMIRKKTDQKGNLLPLISCVVLFGVLWLVWIYLPSLYA